MLENLTMGKLQIFNFIEGRLAKLNAGRGFTDVYEEEITEGRFCRSEYHAKRKIRDMKDKITQKVSYSEFSSCQNQTFCAFKSIYDPQKCCLDRQISSEDSGEVASYNEDSDDSDLEFQSEVSQTGQMNLLEEILDSLSTSHIEQGRLSAAKSLDFLRSIEDLNYNPTNTSRFQNKSSNPHSEFTLENGEQGGWNMGQDDSVVHGKHLPPSPRRQASSRSLPVRPPLPNDLTNEENPRNSLPETPKIQLSVPCDTDKPCSSQLSPDNRQPAGRSLSRQKVFSRKTQRPSQEHAQQKAASRQHSVLVPWEREKQPQETNMEERGNETQEKGLLEEIESMCRMSTALKSNQEYLSRPGGQLVLNLLYF
uniref:DENN/MADD domain containing 1B n=1 Tax=Sinocyclocheilus grahami TaxID=75366 RepID=A0A672R6V3_SINGR